MFFSSRGSVIQILSGAVCIISQRGAGLLNCPARYVGILFSIWIPSWEPINGRHARSASRAGSCQTATLPPDESVSSGSTGRLRRMGFRIMPKGGYAQCRSQTFAGVLPVASRAGSRSSTFGVVRCWFSAFLSSFLSASMEAGGQQERSLAPVRTIRRSWPAAELSCA